MTPSLQSEFLGEPPALKKEHRLHINQENLAFILGSSTTSSYNSDKPAFINLHCATWLLLFLSMACSICSKFAGEISMLKPPSSFPLPPEIHPSPLQSYWQFSFVLHSHSNTSSHIGQISHNISPFLATQVFIKPITVTHCHTV